MNNDFQFDKSTSDSPSVAAKQVYIGPVNCAMNVNMHVQIFLQKEELISATTIRNLQQPADFLQDLNRGW